MRIDVKHATGPITPEAVQTALAPFVSLNNTRADPTQAIHKGMTREQVDATDGRPAKVKEAQQNGLTVVTCTYLNGENAVKADFVNGVLVQYSITSR